MIAFFQFIRCLLSPWTWTMAWRDSRRSRRRLLLYAASIVLGIAALTAISSSGERMEMAVQEQSKALLGADLIVSGRDPFTPEQQEFFKSLGGEQAQETAFPSMVYFLKSQGTRLVQIRALAGEFPFYGSFDTIPAGAITSLRDGSGALVEQNLMDMFDAKVGDLIKVGNLTLPIAGVLTKVPGETMAFGTIAPRVYVPMTALGQSGLLKEGSMARYKVAFKFPPTVNAEQVAEGKRQQFRQLRLSVDTVQERQRDLGRALENMLRFLNLIGFVALLLGGVGVASGIHVHMKDKLATIATLRCLGTSVAQSFSIYFAQAAALGLVGAIAGATIGMVVQAVLPSLLGEFLPFSVPTAVSWKGLWGGIWVGFLICLLFALLPLLPIRRISPLAALRTAFSHEAAPVRDPLIWLAYVLIGAGLVGFGVMQSREWQHGVAYAIAIVVAFSLLALMAWVIAWLARRLVSTRWPFIWRQGFSNLHRPNNRTVLLMVSLGMGTFLVLTLYLVQENLLHELLRSRGTNEGNAVLFDIQSDQKDAVLAVLKAQQLPLLDEVPMVSMRLRSIKGRMVEEIRKDPRSRNWALSREYRSTFREKLGASEKLLSGTWHERISDPTQPAPVSIEQGIARNLHVGLGDEIVFDVQGVEVKTTVASIREVEWRRLSPNFFFVFPLGSIDAAPATHVVVTRIESSEQSARLQREVVRQFPNVSAVDLALILQTVDGVLSKISFVIRFMALFTAGTGVLVLAGSIVSGRYQRLRESILLRTLGATRRQVLQILIVEYVFLGVLAAMTGIVLALAASWGLTKVIFKMNFGFYPVPLLLALATISGLTLVFGLLGNRVILNRPPLEVLRAES